MDSIKVKILIALAAIGFGVLWGLQQVPIDNKQSLSASDWAIPKAYDIVAMSTLASKVKGYKLWLEKKKKRFNGKNKKIALSPIEWHFLGSVKEGSQRLALIKSGKIVKRFSIGDRLPDDALIKNILIDTLVVSNEEGDESHLLFR